MMHGTWDANGWNTLNNNSVDIISNYIDFGKGILTGHDTIGVNFGTKYGLSRIANKFNIIRGIMSESQANGYDINYQWLLGSTKVKITKKGFLTQFPWNLGPVGTVLNIPTAHTMSNAANR